MISSVISEIQKFIIPNWAERIKIDVGTSVNAPFSEHWTNQNDNCFVFAFEPNIYNIDSIYKESGKMWPVWIKKEKLDHSVKILNCALSDSSGEAQFYCTLEDGGTSSLYKPKYSIVKDITIVEKITLDMFFDCFDWDRFPVIEHLKIDAQSADYSILLGISKKYFDRIAYIDIETHTNNQYENDEDPNKIKDLLINNGFECVEFGINATFINSKYKNSEIKYFTLKE